MPAIGANGGIQRGATLPRIAAPKAPAPPRVIEQAPSLPPLLNTRAVHATAPAPVHTNTTGGSDAATSGPGYGSPEANRYKATPAYHQAIKAVFNAQPLPQKAAIVKGITSRAGAYKTPEGKAVLEALRQLGVDDKVALGRYLNPTKGIDLGQLLHVPSAGGGGPFMATASVSAPVKDTMLAPNLGSLTPKVGGAIRSIYDSLLPASVDFRQQATGNPNLPGAKINDAAMGLVSKGFDKLPVNTGLGNLGMPKQEAAGTSVGSQVIRNLGKDAANFYMEALPSLAQVASDTVRSPKQGLQDVLAEPKAIIKDPQQAFIDHPLIAPLTAMAPLHAVTRGAAGMVRAAAPDSAVGRAVSLQREGVALTGNLTRERPHASPYPLIKLAQTSIERSRFERAPTGALVPKTKFQREKMIRQGVAELVSAQERVRRVNRDAIAHQRDMAVRPSLPARAAHGAKTAAKYDPARAMIPGGEVFNLIADGTIRRPETFRQDLLKHIASVSANRGNLLDRADLLKEHDANVKMLHSVASNPPKNLGKLFGAVAKYEREYPQAAQLASHYGYFGDRNPAALQRRTIMHYAVAHMGAKYDPEKGLVDSKGNPLPTQKVLDHIKGQDGTGGRMPVFTSDKPRGDSAYYVTSEQRPLPTKAANTLFAYTHGLTDSTAEGAKSQHVFMQGIADSYKAQNERLNLLTVQKNGGGFWPGYQAAAAEGKQRGLVPISVSQPFHPKVPLEKSLEDVHPALAEEEAQRRGLNLAERMDPGAPGSRWALIDPFAAKALKEQQGLISPNVLLRTVRGLNNQFRQVALGTSAKHVPGVTTENVIRDISYGVGFRSWLTGHRGLARADEMRPGSRRELRARLTGGQVAGATDFAKTRTVAEHYAGTNLYPVLKAFEKTMKAPGARQLRTTWLAWQHFIIQGSKHVLEEQHQIAGLGKQMLREHGYADAARTQGFLGTLKRVLTLHGAMLDDAAKGLFDAKKQRQYRAGINQMYGNWTDLTPTAKTALMFSPFGMWWVNSVRYLARMPVDQPIKSALLASSTVSSQSQRQANGLDPTGPNPLPLYEQGGIPVGGKILAQNYYSPWGVANDPFDTGGSLIEPWVQSVVMAAAGRNWLLDPLSSAANPKGLPSSAPVGSVVAERVQAVLDSALSSFVPLYTKAKQVAEGGASAYDISPHFPMPDTKSPGKGPVAGLKKALSPIRTYAPSTGASSTSRGWGGSSTSGGWGGGSSTGGGWG